MLLKQGKDLKTIQYIFKNLGIQQRMDLNMP